MSEPEIVVVADPEAAAAEAASQTVRALNDAVAARGRADWATTGGSSPIGLYRRLVEPDLADAVPWAGVHVWWGDDRYVPRGDLLSNVRPFDDILLGRRAADANGSTGGSPGVPIAGDHVHPWPIDAAIAADHGAAWCAAALADELRADGPPTADGWPVFDLLMVGAGSDGHILSVFPGSSALASGELAMAIPAPSHISPHVERLTLNPAVLMVARHVLVLATGVSKSMIVEQLLGPVRDVDRWPAQLARSANATWILDEACAPWLAR